MKNRRKAKILVVDDEENIRKSLKMILEYEGYNFLEATDGEEALDIIDETVGLDLILLDVKLPGRDGFEVLAEIKDRPYRPEVIMVSGHGTIKTAVDATKLGAFDFLEIPLHVAPLRSLLSGGCHLTLQSPPGRYNRALPSLLLSRGATSRCRPVHCFQEALQISCSRMCVHATQQYFHTFLNEIRNQSYLRA